MLGNPKFGGQVCPPAYIPFGLDLSSLFMFGDISPCLNGKGFPSSRMGFPASSGVACLSFRPNGSYTPSTGLTSPEPQGRSGLGFRPLHDYSNRYAKMEQDRWQKVPRCPSPSIKRRAIHPHISRKGSSGAG